MNFTVVWPCIPKIKFFFVGTLKVQQNCEHVKKSTHPNNLSYSIFFKNYSSGTVVAESMIRIYLIFSKDYSSGDGGSREHDQEIFNIF